MPGKFFDELTIGQKMTTQMEKGISQTCLKAIVIARRAPKKGRTSCTMERRVTTQTVPSMARSSPPTRIMMATSH